MGYVVGLGDRHLNNILIDLTTAQLVHIDLGSFSISSFNFCLQNFRFVAEYYFI